MCMEVLSFLHTCSIMNTYCFHQLDELYCFIVLTASLDSMARILRTSIYECYKNLIFFFVFVNGETLNLVINAVIFEIFCE